MTMIAEKYADYTTRVGNDSRVSVHYEEQDGQLVRFYCRFFRTPSRTEFLLRLLDGATEDERRHGERTLEGMPAGGWALWPAKYWHKYRSTTSGKYYWMLQIGRVVEDPLIQLELEMMIDATRPVEAAL